MFFIFKWRFLDHVGAACFRCSSYKHWSLYQLLLYMFISAINVFSLNLLTSSYSTLTSVLLENLTNYDKLGSGCEWSASEGNLFVSCLDQKHMSVCVLWWQVFLVCLLVGCCRTGGRCRTVLLCLGAWTEVFTLAAHYDIHPNTLEHFTATSSRTTFIYPGRRAQNKTCGRSVGEQLGLKPRAPTPHLWFTATFLTRSVRSVTRPINMLQNSKS